MAKTEIIGSWFNSGYHGHFRSKSRNDFMCEYRHLAKPAPPKSFVKKIRQPAATHQFSKHDNRQSFLNDALIFQEGLGKRRIANSTLGWKPELLHWGPQRNDMEKNGPHFSQYKVTYRGAPKAYQPLVQQIVHRPKTSFDDDQPRTTSYRYAHGRDNPNKAVLDAMCNTGLARATANKPRQTATTGGDSFGGGRESVAMCMTWCQPHNGNTSSSTTINGATTKTSMTTATPMMAPTPPSAPKPIAPAPAPAPICEAPPPQQPKVAFAEQP